MARKPKFQKLSVNAERRGELRYETAYSAPEAARIAARMTRQGWKVTVQSWRSLGTKRGIYMTCEPRTKEGKKRDMKFRTIAHCKITPAFKKQLKRR